MVHRKINYKVIGSTCLCMLVLFACKKESKDPVGAKIYAVMAHNGQPVSGIKWKIVELEAKGFAGDIESTGWEKNGQTDVAGVSLIEFYPKKNLDFIYDIYFDYSNMNTPQGDYSIVSGHVGFDRLVREYMTPENTYNIRILPKMDVQVHYKNVNCYDGSDQFKFISRNIDEKPQTTLQEMENGNWTDHPGNYGCIDRWGGGNILAGHYVYMWEANKNGTITTGIDTFYVSPDGNNLIEMFW